MKSYIMKFKDLSKKNTDIDLLTAFTLLYIANIGR